MDQTLTVLDISSDEEVGFDEIAGDNFEWISNLLEEFGEGGGNDVNDDGGSDDVVIVGEVPSKPKKKKRSLSPAKMGAEDEDDDCIVLDCGENKGSLVGTDELKDCSDESDDLLVVGEKGQVACRDYPHSRHLCTKFPFSSTPHESHCNLCYCYVCDSVAPCSSWGSTLSAISHCNATDKDEFWKLRRKNARHVKSAPSPDPKVSIPPLPTTGALHNTTRPPDPLLQRYVQRHPVPRPVAVHGVSTFARPNIISQRRIPEHDIILPRNRLQTHLGSRQLLNQSTNNVRRNRNHNLRPHFSSSHAIFKRPGMVRAPVATNLSGQSTPNNVDIVGTQQEVGKPNGSIPVRLPVSSSSGDLIFGAYGHSGQRHEQLPVTSSTPSQFQVYVQRVPILLSQAQECAQLTTDSLSQQPHRCIQPTTLPCGNPNIQPYGYIRSTALPDVPSSSPHCTPQPPAVSSIVEDAVAMPDMLPATEHCSLPHDSMNLSPLDLDYSSWLIEDQSISGSQEGSLFTDMNYVSSVAAPIDAGMLYFDFETSWKGLAHS